ncbi:carbohydrate ABC transporter permease [Natrarchaeobius oligotrophus]|uniref:Sugar ABC transporter permease n=1 Tax=Natrarchaeobius chitinivorans TaxID=1679083 RepID=A0A3N6MEY1_NATCH|nr:sugar ABC transporter permease [Natrarchaeobius chitinivorans]RQH02564.1 sugar ABC transporter permease [Natrarchaeobius chitinivorans]
MNITESFKHREWPDLSRKGRVTILAWIAALPALTVIVLYRIIPILYNFYLSFNEMSYTGELTFVGLSNYRNLLHDPVFLRSLANTFALMATIPVGIAVALGLAILLNQKFPGRNVFRSAIFLPYIIMMVGIGVIWQYMFQTDAGVINYLLLQTGLVSDPIRWLSSSRWALISVLIVQVWKTVGFYMIILLAGIQMIPTQVYEVARIDGASRWQRFRHITLPLLRPTIGVCFLVGIVTTYRAFDLIMVMMPQGGPNHSAEILLTWMYKQAFSYGEFGYGAVLTMVMYVVVLLMVFAGWKLQRRSFE